MKDQTTETTETTETADQYEMKYFNKVYFTDVEYGRRIIAAIQYLSDAIAFANVVEYAIDGTVTVENVFGEIEHTREIQH